MKRYFLASLTALCIMATLVLAVYLDNSKMVQQNAMLRSENDSLTVQIEARYQLIDNMEETIQRLHKEILTTKYKMK
ncbi:MAG TPA: hypothetical protein PLV65_05315 [Tenuifilaceae bacterium]|nr:hypothetical protein [Tenuifilaceae bacterium]